MIEMLGKNVGTVAEENKKLNKVEVGKTRHLSSVQIHVKKSYWTPSTETHNA